MHSRIAVLSFQAARPAEVVVRQEAQPLVQVEVAPPEVGAQVVAAVLPVARERLQGQAARLAEARPAARPEMEARHKFQAMHRLSPISRRSRIGRAVPIALEEHLQLTR